jgi:hypothetical protein
MCDGSETTRVGGAVLQIDSEVFIVPEAHRAAVLEGLEQAERGEFASDCEMEMLWKHCGL